MAKSRQRIRKKTQLKSKPVISPMLIVGVVAGSLLLVGGLILLGNQNQNTSTGVSPDIEQLPSLGEANAPVVMEEYSDFG